MNETNFKSNAAIFPPLPLDEWEATNDTLHLWTQIVGKIRLGYAPPINEWWHVPLYVTPRGLTTALMFYENESFAIDFDFVSHELVCVTGFDDGFRFRLEPMTVADFHRKLFDHLSKIGIEARISSVPDELKNPIPFAEDVEHQSYDAAAVEKFFRALLSIDRVFKNFRTGFKGKCSPVHFFWGSFDLAVTRFNGKDAPPKENADKITRIAYNQEVISHGFWTGKGFGEAAFYSYAAPAPNGYEAGKIKPDAAFFSKELGEYLLPYEAVRQSENPEKTLLNFMQSSYEVGANLADWDRKNLETDASRIT